MPELVHSGVRYRSSGMENTDSVDTLQVPVKKKMIKVSLLILLVGYDLKHCCRNHCLTMMSENTVKVFALLLHTPSAQGVDILYSTSEHVKDTTAVPQFIIEMLRKTLTKMDLCFILRSAPVSTELLFPAHCAHPPPCCLKRTRSKTHCVALPSSYAAQHRMFLNLCENTLLCSSLLMLSRFNFKDELEELVGRHHPQNTFPFRRWLQAEGVGGEKLWSRGRRVKCVEKWVSLVNLSFLTPLLGAYSQWSFTPPP